MILKYLVNCVLICTSFALIFASLVVLLACLNLHVCSKQLPEIVPDVIMI